jgi:hypothetical protein
MIDFFAAPDAVEDQILFGEPVRREQAQNGLADHFVGGITENRRGGPVPAGNDAVQILADDCVIGGFDDGGEVGARVLRGFEAADIHQHIDRADQRPGRVAQRRRIGQERDTAAVRTLQHRLHPADCPVLLQGHGHRAAIVPQWHAVRGIETPGHAPLVFPEPRLAPGEFDGGAVVVGDPALGVGRVDRRRQRIENRVEEVFIIRAVDEHSFGPHQGGGGL